MNIECEKTGRPHRPGDWNYEGPGGGACEHCGIGITIWVEHLIVHFTGLLKEQTAQIAVVTAQVAHLTGELEADVEHILELGKERDELLRQNEQLKRGLEEALDGI